MRPASLQSHPTPARSHAYMLYPIPTPSHLPTIFIPSPQPPHPLSTTSLTNHECNTHTPPPPPPFPPPPHTHTDQVHRRPLHALHAGGGHTPLQELPAHAEPGQPGGRGLGREGVCVCVGKHEEWACVWVGGWVGGWADGCGCVWGGGWEGGRWSIEARGLGTWVDGWRGPRATTKHECAACALYASCSNVHLVLPLYGCAVWLAHPPPPSLSSLLGMANHPSLQCILYRFSKHPCNPHPTPPHPGPDVHGQGRALQEHEEQDVQGPQHGGLRLPGRLLTGRKVSWFVGWLAWVSPQPRRLLLGHV